MTPNRCPRQPAIEPLEGRTLLSAVIYGTDDAGRLFTIDTSSGQTHIIGTMSAIMWDIAENAQGQLFGVAVGGELYRIDPASAATTAVGPTGTGVNSLAFASDGTLYGALDSLYTIDMSSGKASLVGNLGGPYSAGDLAFDNNGDLYLSTDGSGLVRINRLTGKATSVGSNSLGRVFGMVFGSDAVMYGFAFDTDRVISINLADGSTTPVSTLINVGTILGAASAPPSSTLLPPSGVQASDARFTNRIAISWHAVTGARSYSIWRSETNSFDSAIQLPVDVVGLSYDDKSAKAGTTHYYWVTANSSMNTSLPSNPDAGSVDQVPGVPQLLGPANNAVVGFRPSFTVKTTDPEKQSVSFQLEIRFENKTTTFFRPAVRSGAKDAFQFPTASSVPYGVATWRARAKDVGGYSGWSISYSITFAAGADTTALPTGSDWQMMQDAGAGFFIAPAWGGKNKWPNAQSQLTAARNLGLNTAAYSLLNFTANVTLPSGAQQVDNAIDAVGSELSSIKFMAIDVEIDNSGVNFAGKLIKPDAAIAEIRSAIDRVIRKGLKPVIYTSNYAWTTLTNGSTLFSSVPLWEATSAGGCDLNARFVAFGGWQRRTGKQYDLNKPSFGLNKVDLDVFDPSIFA